MESKRSGTEHQLVEAAKAAVDSLAAALLWTRVPSTEAVPTEPGTLPPQVTSLSASPATTSNQSSCHHK